MTRRHEDSDDDTFVTLGSAFEKLETVEDVERAKRKKDKEQYVTDDKGRRRFHGAFTGGFSAGYFNTVGSEEGWTPSNFKSTKGKKPEFSRQRPEDFMDEEDLGYHGIAPRAVTAKDSFNQKDSFSAATDVGSKKEAGSLRAVIPGVPPLQNLIVPARITVGVRLLKAMGWKEGQGVGPKTAKYTSREGQKKVYGCALSNRKDEGEEEGGGGGGGEGGGGGRGGGEGGGGRGGGPSNYPKEAEGFLFAPSDVTPWEVEGKDDMHGIGYHGIRDQGVLGARKSTKSLYGMSGEAFGVGALEDEDEDEDNVYGVEALTSYDSALAAEGDINMERKFGWTGGHQTGDWGLSSFKKASRQTVNTQKYPGPVVPREFVCLHKFAASLSTTSQVEDDNSKMMKPLTSMARTQMLSDNPDSVFSLLSQSDQEKLRRVSEQVKSGKALGSSDKEKKEPHPQEGNQRQLEEGSHRDGKSGRPDVQSFDASGMKPFARNPAEQVRYEAFLSGKSVMVTEPRMTEWETQKEEDKFARAAKVFRPLTSALASRFTRGEEIDETKKKEKMPERPLTPESDAVQAAKANMFGILTREVSDWHPHKILCRRFDIPDPYPNSSIVGVASGKDKTRERGSKINFLHTQRILATEEDKDKDKDNKGSLHGDSSKSGELKPSSHSSENKDAAVSADTDTKITEEVIQERPPMDIFKAIFAESSSEEEDSSSSDSESEVKPLSTTPTSNSHEIENPKEKGSKWQDLSVITNTVIPPNKIDKPSFDLSQDKSEHSQNQKTNLPATAESAIAVDNSVDGNRHHDNQHQQYHHHQWRSRGENPGREHHHGDTRRRRGEEHHHGDIKMRRDEVNRHGDAVKGRSNQTIEDSRIDDHHRKAEENDKRERRHGDTREERKSVKDHKNNDNGGLRDISGGELQRGRAGEGGEMTSIATPILYGPPLPPGLSGSDGGGGGGGGGGDEVVLSPAGSIHDDDDSEENDKRQSKKRKSNEDSSRRHHETKKKRHKEHHHKEHKKKHKHSKK